MKKDEFTKQVTSKLDQLAREQHHNKMLVMNHVLDSVQKKHTSFYSIWKMTGFAFAAAIWVLWFCQVLCNLQINHKIRSS